MSCSKCGAETTGDAKQCAKCSGASAAQPTPAAPKKSPLPIIIAIVVVLGIVGVLAFVFMGGGGSPGKTPKATFESACSAVKSENWGGLYDVTSSEKRKEMDEMFKECQTKEDSKKGMIAEMGVTEDEFKKCKNGRDFCILMLNAMKKKGNLASELKRLAKTSNVTKEEINGNNATITYEYKKDDGSTVTDTVKMLKEGDLWYIND